MNRVEAERLIEQAAAGKVHVGFTKHFWDEAGSRVPGLTKNDVYTMLRRGRIYGAPVRDDEYLCHKIKIRGGLPDLGRLEIVVAITVHDSLVCITIYDLD